MALTLPSGLAGQIGYNGETTYGTGTTVTRFLPLVSESLTNSIGRIESSAIIAGRRVMDNDQWRSGNHTIAGDVQHEITDNSIGLLLEHCFGTVDTSGADPYTHAFWPALLTGKGLTVQVGRPNIAGTVNPYTYAGCKVASWEIAGEVDQPGTMGLSLVAQSETLATALASASYGSSDTLLTFVQGVCTLAGSTPTRVRSFRLSVDNGLDTSRFTVGGSQIVEPLEAGLRAITGEMVLDYGGTTEYARVRDAGTAAVVLGFDNGTNELKFNLNCRFDGDTPTIGGPGVLEQRVQFMAVGTTDAHAFSGTLVNSDSTA